MQTVGPAIDRSQVSSSIQFAIQKIQSPLRQSLLAS